MVWRFGGFTVNQGSTHNDRIVNTNHFREVDFAVIVISVIVLGVAEYVNYIFCSLLYMEYVVNIILIVDPGFISTLP